MMAALDERDRELLARIGSVPPPAPVPVRAARPSDHGFVLGAWTDSLRNERIWKGVDRDAWRTELARIVGRLVTSPDTTIRVAHDPDDDDVIIGFAAMTPPTLHYVYVRSEFRGHGIVPALLDGLDINAFSFRTEAFVRRLQPFTRAWKYTPKFTF